MTEASNSPGRGETTHKKAPVKGEGDERYSILFNTMLQGVVHQDSDGKIISINPAAVRILGRTLEESYGDAPLTGPRDSIREDRSPFPESEHPSTVALRTGREVRDVVMGVYNPREKGYRWVNVCAIPLLRKGRELPSEVITLLEDITERNRMREEATRLVTLARLEKDWMSSLVNSIKDEVWFSDATKKFTLANPSALREFGLPQDAKDIEVEGLAASLEVYRSNGTPRPVDEAPPLRALRGEVVRNEDEIVRTPGTGELRHRQVTASPVKDESGKIIGSVSVVRDVTENWAAEDALRSTRDYLEKLLDYANAPIIVWDPSSRITQFNHAFEHITGRRASEVTGKDLSILFPSDTKDESLAKIKRTLSGEHWESVEIPILRRDGTTRIALWNSANIYGDDGRTLVATIAQGQDITERKEADAALREYSRDLKSTSDYLEKLFNYANAPIIVWDPSHKITRFNHAFERMTGLSASEVIGKDLSILFPQETKEDSLTEIKRAATGEHWESVEIPILRKDGRGRIALWNSANIYGDDGKTLVATIAQGQDITERTQAQNALKDEKNKLQFILDSLPVAVGVSDADGKFLLTNSRMSDIWCGDAPQRDISRDEWVGYHPQTGERLKAEEWPIARAIRKGETVHNEEIDIVRLDGKRRTILKSAVPMRDSRGRITGGLVAFMDITAQKDFEKALARSNTELQGFAYAASHDLREPLRTISGFLELLSMDYGEQLDDKAKDYIGRAVRASSRLHNMIDDLLSFSRLETRKQPFGRVDLNEILKAALSDLNKTITDHEAVVTSESLPTVWADDQQMAIVFRNLIDNGVKFHRKQPPKVEISAKRKADEWQISFRDNGIGIDPRYQGRIFNMFARLHDQKEYPGNGIGLAMCRKIVERHGGRIWVESEAGKGSAFFITLPDYATGPSSSPDLECSSSADRPKSAR